MPENFIINEKETFSGGDVISASEKEEMLKKE